MSELLSALIGAVLVNHLLLGLPAAADMPRHARMQALGPAGALLILFAAPLAWLLHRLLPADLGYLSLMLLLPLLAGLSWLSLLLLARLRPSLVQPAGLWPLLLINGASLSAMLISQALESFDLALAVGLAAGLGFWLLLQLFADLLERVGQCDVPMPFRGTPMLLICAGLLSLASLGLNGLGPI
ncbi:Rnf-Nqr domain containing protein [Pseudomonas sp.]|uniref:Rnf-Nqr domain containing protein n=1 Tax=Pseudomonas sp. TaxID=306 RepID=UPI003C7712E8